MILPLNLSLSSWESWNSLVMSCMNYWWLILRSSDLAMTLLGWPISCGTWETAWLRRMIMIFSRSSWADC